MSHTTQNTTVSQYLSLVIPVHNEADGLALLYKRLVAVTADLSIKTEFLFINDGSQDESLNILEAFRTNDSRIAIVNLSRCYGKESAVTAGLAHAIGDALIILDADLQDPPECIPDMVHAWREGYDVVAMQRADRSVDTWSKRTSAALFYRMLNWLSDVPIPENVGDFRLLSRRVVDALNQLPEQNRYMKGLFSWVGFRTRILQYTRAARQEGDTKWSTLKLFGLAVDGVTAFSIKPLRIATLVGAVAASLSFLFGVTTVIKAVLYGDPVAGFPTLISVITFLGGMQLLAAGVLGEYIGRMFIETKRRPLFLVESYKPANVADSYVLNTQRQQQKQQQPVGLV